MVIETPSYYAILPANVRYDKRLSDKSKLLFAEIMALTNKTGECWATNKYFADLYGVSTRTISTIINQLIEYKYLDSTNYYLKGTKAIEKRVLKIASIPMEENFHTPMEENFQENITSKNITSKKEINKERHQYGLYKNVLLTDEDLEKLKEEFPDDWKERIERVSSYCASIGKTYNNYLATIRNWARKDKAKSNDELPKYDTSKNKKLSDKEIEELLSLRKA